MGMRKESRRIRRRVFPALAFLVVDGGAVVARSDQYEDACDLEWLDRVRAVYPESSVRVFEYGWLVCSASLAEWIEVGQGMLGNG
jgi:hypothetical protein